MRYFIVVCFLYYLKLTNGYRGAVVEYSPTTADSPENTILKNLNEYSTFIQRAKTQGADIIVFPEYGLTTMVADPEGYAVALTPDAPIVTKLSTLAKQATIYLVVNLLEKVDTRTPKYYNTNLVFDRNGNVIKKYRKINLFGEPNLAPGSSNQSTIFSTDFGVTFGIFTCFDILYTNPSRTVLTNNITDVVYPTSWFSTMPFYASLSVQHGYSTSTKVNLLAANLGEPQNTHGGSGIYLVDGTSNIHITDVASSKLLIQDVPGKTVPQVVRDTNMSNYETLRDFRAADYNFKKIDLSQTNQSTNICYNEFCCTFDLTVGESNCDDVYKIMAFDGVVPFDVSTAHIRVCSLLLCANATNDSCGARIKPGTIFTKMSVRTNVEKNSSFYNPLTLDLYLRPLLHSTFDTTQLSTLQESSDVVVFGIFGRLD
ncbi:vanin-like protein 2 [Zophobas morio]|uniref:vanin-like protein 2 n=1 Tax=Zophobas morio TaxID=2755281 RepID=UPI003082DF41